VCSSDLGSSLNKKTKKIPTRLAPDGVSVQPI
jgi:hypothetical protein